MTHRKTRHFEARHVLFSHRQGAAWMVVSKGKNLVFPLGDGYDSGRSGVDIVCSGVDCGRLLM